MKVGAFNVIDKSELLRLLTQVPDDTSIFVNRVGNLGILNSSQEPIGFIDINDVGSLVIFPARRLNDQAS